MTDTTQPEALQLAEANERYSKSAFTPENRSWYASNAVELRRQHAEIERLRGLLSEVAAVYTRGDDLPNNLLPRIDAALNGVEPTGEDCSVCGEPQFDTPSGPVCKNGHGGA